MELGNMIFGNSRGEYEVPRDDDMWFQLKRLADATGNDTYFYNHFENDTFAVRSYCWDDCDCGFDERWEKNYAGWAIAHPHSPDCYQTELDAEMRKYDAESGYSAIDAAVHGTGDRTILDGFDVTFDSGEPAPGVVVTTMISVPRRDSAMERWRAAYDKRREFMDGLYDRLCRKHNKSAQGCAVHCTCGRDKLYEEFAATDDHAPTCCTVLPNFLFKPTGFELRWYKYPLRDSYSNMKVDVASLRKMVNACIRSLGKQPEDY